MKALFIGGTGNISRACVKKALQDGWEVYLLNRGTRNNLVPEGARSIQSDMRDVQETKKRLVPSFQISVPLHIGLRRSWEWYDNHPDLKKADPKTDTLIEKILSEWKNMAKTVGRGKG